MTETNETHWAAVTWHGTNDLADTEFIEMLSADSKHSLYNLCRIWAEGNLSSATKYKVRYVGEGMADKRDNDPRKTIPLSTRHEMNSRQRAAFDEAMRVLGLHENKDHTACQEWCAAV